MASNRRSSRSQNRDEDARVIPLFDVPADSAGADEVDLEALGEALEREQVSPENIVRMRSQFVGELLHALQPTARDTTPLQAEIYVSGLLGQFRRLAPADADMESFVEEELLAAVAEAGGDSALAFLRVMETLGETPEQCKAARTYAHEVAARRAKAARWSNLLGTVSVEDCWGLSDVFGDQTSLLCVYAYDGRRHGLMALLDFEHPEGWAKDLYPVGEDELEAVERELRATVTAHEGAVVLERVEPSRARSLLEAGIAAADRLQRADDADEDATEPDEPDEPDELDDAATEDTYAFTRALALARIRTMPQPTNPEADEGSVAAVLTDDEQNAVVRRFLASPQAAELAGDEAARELASLAVEYFCYSDPARPLRVSPGRIAQFLLEFVPSEVELSAEAEAQLPHVIEAWARWRAAEEGLPPAAVGALDAAVQEIIADYQGRSAGPALPPALAALLGDGAQPSDFVELLQGLAGGFRRERELPDVEGDPDAVYVVRVDLAHAKPPIWRRLRIPSDVSLAQLHRVLQAAFEWYDSHLHKFQLPGRDRDELPLELGSEPTRRLYQLLVEPRDRLEYVYDFGDDWEHRIVLEKVEPADGVRRAVCVAGRRAAPLEDSGGIPGYEMLCATLADPSDPEHEELVDWARGIHGIEGPFDPARFDKDELTERLSAVPFRRRKKR